MLEELGVAYELLPINLSKGEQHRPEFLKISPNGKIPAIVDLDGPDGKTVTLAESAAVLIYLGEKYGRFIPADAVQRLATLQWIMFQMAHVGPMVGQLHHFQVSAPAGNGYAIERYKKESERLMDVLEIRLAESLYLANADYTIADICTWPWVRSWIFTTKQELGPRRALRRWFEAIDARPAVKKAVSIYDQLRASNAKR